MVRSILLVLCFVTGWFLPGLSVHREWMNYLLFYMVQVVFLRMHFDRGSIHWRHAVILALNIVIPLALWRGMLLCGAPERFAQVAFFTAITPSATSSPVIVGALGGRISFTAMGFLLSALVMSALYPVLLPYVLGQSILTAISFEEGTSLWQMIQAYAQQPVCVVFKRVLFVTLLPLVLAFIARRIWGEKARAVGQRLMGSTLYVWMILVILIAACASDFIATKMPEGSTRDILWVLVIDLAICVLCFAIGALVGGKAYRRECSQLLGQKNTSYTTILAIQSGNPFVALGPAFYVFFHNAWNGLQLMFHKSPPRSPNG